MTLVADVPNPVAFRPVLASVLRRLLGLDRKPTTDDRQHRMGEAVAKRLPGAVRDQYGMRLVGDIQDPPATVDPADIGAIRLVRRHNQRMHADPRVEGRDAWRGGDAVPPPRARNPPAAGPAGMPRIPDVDDHQELVTQLVARREVARA